MSNTVMTLHRKGSLVSDTKDEIIHITEELLEGNDDYIFNLKNSYEVGYNLVDVYLNGQKLYRDESFSEYDNNSIQIHLGEWSDGTKIELEPGDALLIRVRDVKMDTETERIYFDERVSKVEKEIRDARRFLDSDTAHPTLDSRLDYIQRQIMAGDFGEYTVQYEYNHPNGLPTKEIISGEHTIIREFEYNSINEISEERIIFEGKMVVKIYHYDLSTKRLISSEVKTVDLP